MTPCLLNDLTTWPGDDDMASKQRAEIIGEINFSIQGNFPPSFFFFFFFFALASVQ